MKTKKMLTIYMVFLCILSLASCKGRKQSPPSKQEDQQKEKGYIVFVNAEGPDQNTMYRVDEDGKKKEKVIEKSIISASASGGRIAFIAKDENKLQTLYVITADGSENMTVMNNTYIIPGSLSWSSDRSKITYSARTPSDKGNEVYYVEAGKYKTPLRVTDDDASNVSPKFSNDARFIIYAKNANGNYDIYKFETGSGKNTNISNNTANDMSPAVSPDGTEVFFLSDESEKGKYDLYSMNMDGGNRTKLTNGLNIEPDSIRISPDSSMIAFVTKGEKGSKAIQVIDMNKSAVLISNGGYLASWSSDSKSLYFAASDKDSRKLVKYDITGRKTKDALKVQIKPGEEAEGIKFIHFTDKLK